MEDSKANYFNKLNATLRAHERALPFLLIDLDKVDHNITQFKKILNPNAHLRIVVKSLPSLPLVQYIMRKMDTTRLMVFHQPFLTQLVGEMDVNVDILLGKPMPIKTVEFFYHYLPFSKKKFNPYLQIQWLVDTLPRIEEYINLAKSIDQKIRINLEIDVGLHRGGFDLEEQLYQALKLIQQNNKYVEFSGFMGYDPHVTKIPSILRSIRRSMNMSTKFYQICIDMVRKEFPDLWNERLTFNGAGSPTIKLHTKEESILNDISAGSCFVQPTTFDTKELEGFVPASFIATPILKKMEYAVIPGLEYILKWIYNLGLSKRRAYFIYGGAWKAAFFYPEGIKTNNLYGESTNQCLVTTKKSTTLDVDDFIFLRPHQSEFVFLQFGDLVIIRNGKIVDHWEIFKN